MAEAVRWYLHERRRLVPGRAVLARVGLARVDLAALAELEKGRHDHYRSCYWLFILLPAGHPECVAIWQKVTEGRARDLVSCLVLAELRRLALKGLIETADADLLDEALGAVCQVTWIDRPEVLQRAAHLAHGAGLPLVAALIVAGLESEGALEIWTTDGGLARCDREGF